LVETGLVCSVPRRLYAIDAATTHLSVLAYVMNDPSYAQRLSQTTSVLVAIFTVDWLAIFAIKFSFLALFYRMLRNVDRWLRVYFWFSVAMTAISGVVIILENLIICSKFGAIGGM
jgi:hypothetical protein